MELKIRLRSIHSLTDFVVANRSRQFGRPFQVRVTIRPEDGPDRTPHASTIVNPDVTGSILTVPVPDLSPNAVDQIEVEILPRSVRGGQVPYATTGRLLRLHRDGVAQVLIEDTTVIDDSSMINLYMLTDWLNALTTLRNDHISADTPADDLRQLVDDLAVQRQLDERTWRNLSQRLPDAVAGTDDIAFGNERGQMPDKWDSATFEVAAAADQVTYTVAVLEEDGGLYGTCAFGVRIRGRPQATGVELERRGLTFTRPGPARIRRSRRNALEEVLDNNFIPGLQALIGSPVRDYRAAAIAIARDRARRGLPRPLDWSFHYVRMSSTVIPAWQPGGSVSPVAAHRPVYRGAFMTLEPVRPTRTLGSWLRPRS